MPLSISMLSRGNYKTERDRMVDQQLVTRQLRDPRVLAAMRRIPRHRFVPQAMLANAYADHPLPIGLDQTISQPYIIALMLHILALTGSETVLEIGTGSGYQTALLAELTHKVYSIERHAALAESARTRLAALKITNVEITVGDGSIGLAARAPFDAIIIAAATPALPMAMLAQLGNSGRLIAPIGDRAMQYIECVTRKGTTWKIDQLLPVMFVPLIGTGGFAADMRM